VSAIRVNRRRWQSLCGQNVDELVEKMSFQTAFEGVIGGDV